MLLRAMEDVEKNGHSQAAKCINERGKQRHRRNQIPQDVEEGEDEIPEQESRHQYRPHECQQRRIFQSHGGSMKRSSHGMQPVLQVSRSTGCARKKQRKRLTLTLLCYGRSATNY